MRELQQEDEREKVNLLRRIESEKPYADKLKLLEDAMKAVLMELDGHFGMRIEFNDDTWNIMIHQKLWMRCWVGIWSDSVCFEPDGSDRTYSTRVGIMATRLAYGDKPDGTPVRRFTLESDFQNWLMRDVKDVVRWQRKWLLLNQ